ncbi:MAG: hypothetical protein WDW38_005571 [Sanguina aurantia]
MGVLAPACSGSVTKAIPRNALALESYAADSRIRNYVLQTPLLASQWLTSYMHPSSSSEGAAAQAAAYPLPPVSVWMKMESEQISGSFKARGAFNKLLSLTPEQQAAGLYAASSGNHALAMVDACLLLASQHQEGSGTTAASTAGPMPMPVLYLSTAADGHKIKKLKEKKAVVVIHGDDAVQAEVACREKAEAVGGTYVSPYNDFQVAGGQGTIAVEMLRQRQGMAPLDVVFIPVGGGGLIAGIASVLKATDPPPYIIACQPAASDVMRVSVLAGKVLDLPSDDTLSDGTAGGVEAGTMTFEPCCSLVDQWVTISEQEIADAMIGVLHHHGKIIEGAAGVVVAAFQQLAPTLVGKQVALVICGGNVSTATLRQALSMSNVDSA